MPDAPQTTDPHPWYGPCDALGPGGTCVECDRQATPLLRLRECVVCGYRWLGSETDRCRWEPHSPGVEEPNIKARELIRRLRDPSKKMLDAMAKAMSPGRRPTDNYVPVREKHRIRFVAAIEQMLEEIEWPK